jgi:hypothetical protein
MSAVHETEARPFVTAHKPSKPLNAKAYGSIGHLPNSRMGPADHHVHEGQAIICTQKARKGDRIIVSEKLDGSCMSVANINGAIVALTRSGYRACEVTYPHLQIFSAYVAEREDQFRFLVNPGERVVGEWLAMAHGTIYDPEHPGFSPFVVFDIFRDGKRILYHELCERLQPVDMTVARCLHDYSTPMCVDGALAALGEFGHHGALEQVEGAVWRVEREGRVDFLAKYVRPNKIDGKYLPNIAEADPIWFWQPSAAIRSLSDHPSAEKE